MRKILAFVFCFVSFVASVFAAGPEVPVVKTEKARKIIVLTSNKGGNGHMAACAVLKDTFPNDNLILIDPINDLFGKVFDYGDVYSSFFQNGWIRSINFVTRYPGSMYFKMNRGTNKKTLLKYFKKEKPDMVISVIPLLNYPASWAADQCNIPYMNITLDADLTLWLLDMQRCKKHNFIITTQAKTPLIERQLKHRRIPASCVREVGCSLRKDFFEKKDIQAIKKEWNIPAGKKVILLMRGGTGSNKLVDYVDALVELDQPLHLMVCIGRNTKLIKELEEIRKEVKHDKKNKGNVTFTIVPFTKKIPDLMAISDVLVAQSSPTVCNEAIHMNLPIIVDRSSPTVFWEKATMDWVNMFGYGKIFKRMRTLKKLVVESLDKKQELMAQKSKQNTNFNASIYGIVNDLIAKNKLRDSK